MLPNTTILGLAWSQSVAAFPCVFAWRLRQFSNLAFTYIHLKTIFIA
ncbi:hypothetical protein Lpp225_2476 [Lacticaseibacillus paracasei subsp. paracasei Lpp225]|uniref:Uncharacterized protein n=1 Tax=Lacticaseibacillus paracasei subsp. paracasei Lpp225 TaxID=1256225 RepID=S2N6S7_LACPA|nr:hypothetical protein LCA32G_0505 [Lacticaseibacillus paracasei]EPC36492.1 hypothetical protein Lpp225_2476 [Lacticaseibacillus paracasei subsp. paracasei Lpp225]